MIKPLRASVPAMLLLLSLLPALACDEGRGSPVGPSSVDVVPPSFDFDFDFDFRQRVEVVSGDGQVAQPGSLLAPLVVRVTDTLGAPVENARVFWTIVSGNLALTPSGNASEGADAVTSTDSTGLTQVRVTLGPQPGTHRIEARSKFSSNPVIFVATGS